MINRAEFIKEAQRVVDRAYQPYLRDIAFLDFGTPEEQEEVFKRWEKQMADAPWKKEEPKAQESKAPVDVNKPAPKKVQPTVGCIVLYKMAENEAAHVNHIRLFKPGRGGNKVFTGQELPMVVVAVWPDSVNGQVFLDGPDSLWVTSAHEGKEPGTWHWPERA